MTLSCNKCGCDRTLEKKYKKLRDAIKDEISIIVNADYETILAKPVLDCLQRALDSVENEK